MSFTISIDRRQCLGIAGFATVVLGCSSLDPREPPQGLAANAVYAFDEDVPGSVPAGWTADVTGSKTGTAPRWEVREDQGGNVLAQLESGGARGDFPVCLKQDSTFQDGTVSVRLKPISGNVDQAGGIVFRAKDKDNFYVVRANAKEDNVSIYYTVDGERSTMKYWQDIEVALADWHTLRVEARGFTFTVWLNDELVGEIEDTDRVFPDAGMVGVWTKADSVTYFTNLATDPGGRP